MARHSFKSTASSLFFALFLRVGADVDCNSEPCAVNAPSMLQTFTSNARTNLEKIGDSTIDYGDVKCTLAREQQTCLNIKQLGGANVKHTVNDCQTRTLNDQECAYNIFFTNKHTCYCAKDGCLSQHWSTDGYNLYQCDWYPKMGPAKVQASCSQMDSNWGCANYNELVPDWGNVGKSLTQSDYCKRQAVASDSCPTNIVFGTGSYCYCAKDDCTSKTHEPGYVMYQCGEPTPDPTAKPTTKPTAKPTAEPTATPTPDPTTKPTAEPTATPDPTPTPTPATPDPTAKPTAEPTATPDPTPTPTPATPEPTTYAATPSPAPGCADWCKPERINKNGKVKKNKEHGDKPWCAPNKKWKEWGTVKCLWVKCGGCYHCKKEGCPECMNQDGCTRESLELKLRASVPPATPVPTDASVSKKNKKRSS